MFTMMNYMRLGVGAQGVGRSDRSYQAAVAYARDRMQGRAPGEKGRVAIIRHPDIRRTLLLMRALTQAGRAISYYTARCLDRGNHGADAGVRGGLAVPRRPDDTDRQGVAHGGRRRKSRRSASRSTAAWVTSRRPAPRSSTATFASRSIYEGTNAIQAIDLVGRKLLRDGGATVSAFVSEMRDGDAPLANAGEDFAASARRSRAGSTKSCCARRTC